MALMPWLSNPRPYPRHVAASLATIHKSSGKSCLVHRYSRWMSSGNTGFSSSSDHGDVSHDQDIQKLPYPYQLYFFGQIRGDENHDNNSAYRFQHSGRLFREP